MCSLDEYLKSIKDNINKLSDYEFVHVVVGNESCDLDSMISAISLAYYYYLTKDHTKTLFVPLLNINSEDIIIRTENVYLLRKYYIELHDVVYQNEIDLNKIHSDNKLKLTLVDHHVLSREMEKLKDSVLAIFDHRPRDGSVTWDDNVEIHISNVGSCTTIIANLILTDFKDCLCSVLPLLYETIIYDTIGFKEEAGKAKELDFEIADKIEAKLRKHKSRTRLFEELWREHNNVESLTPYHLLMKDLKVIDSIYIPGVPMLVSEFLTYDGVKSAITKFAKEKNATIIILMGLKANVGVERDLAIYCPNKHDPLFAIVKKNLENSELQLQNTSCNMDHAILYKQINVTMSRKQIIPIVKQSLEEQKNISK